MSKSIRSGAAKLIVWGAGASLLASAAGCATSSTSSEFKNGRKMTSEDKARMQIQVADGALMEGDPIGALQVLAQAEQSEPGIAELHHTKALAFRMRGDLDNALISAKRAVELKPDYSDASNTLGKLLLDAGHLKEAEAPLLKATKDLLYRDVFKPLTNLGILYYRQGDFGHSKIYMDKAIVASPVNACVAYYYRGHLRLRENRLSEAIRDYELATTRRSCANFPDAHLALGIAYEKTQRYDMARKKFVEIQNRYPATQVADQAMRHLRYLP